MQKILLLLLLITGLNLSAQDDEMGKRTTIVFVSSEIIANENFDNDQLITWLKAVQQAMDRLMKTEKSNSIVKIIPSWTINRHCTYEISVCPENTALLEQTRSALKDIESPVARIAPFQLLLSFRFNEGCKETESFSPQAMTATEKMMQRLGSGTLAERKELIRNWALQEVIPVLSHFTITVDQKFEGVRYTGGVLGKKSFLQHATAAVTDKNPLYWRGMMEMSRGNLIIPVSKIFMLIANDEFDLARRYISITYRFADKKSLAFHYMLELNNYLNVFYKHHDELIHEGISLHDKGKFDAAIAKYNEVLAVYPYSAWALYEIYFSIKGRDAGSNADKTTALWSAHKQKVYSADPLYPMGGGANTSKDGYILFRHMEIGEIFKDSKKQKEDIIRFADIALDLEEYAFAAYLFWNNYTYFGEEIYKGHNFLAYYLYSLEKLGVTEIKTFFKTDYKTEFAAIEAERLEAMKNDPIYKSFKEQ